jgi:hypothetical protein
MAALLVTKFSVDLDKKYVFEAPEPTPISASKTSEFEVKRATAVFEFKASHRSLESMVANRISIEYLHSDRFSDEVI